MIYTNVSGIPCQVKVTAFNKEVSYNGIDEYEVKFSIYDRRGYKAAWLERKMTDEDRSRIEREIIQFHQKEESKRLGY